MADENNSETKITLAILAVDLGYIRAKIDQMHVDMMAYDKRLEKVERSMWVLSGVGGAIATVVIALVIAYLKGAMGI